MSSKYFKHFYHLLFLTNLIILSFDKSYSSSYFELSTANLIIIILYVIEDTIRLCCWTTNENKPMLIIELILDSISFVNNK